MNSEQIRKSFLEFFKSKGHKIVPSSSLIPDDPSVLFTTAGMQQFKPYYMGEKSPYGDNVASVQKCFRTSDIDEVGDESHLTFFEMLGNFSFGGYFKEKAVEYAYEFITKELGLKIDYVSIFGGDEEIPEDKESEKIWKKIAPGIEIKKFGKEDNFWGPTGEEGPCGPTTEIYVNGIEIWNIVFNEFYKNKEGKFEKLKTPGVDTGMGLERLAMVVQKKDNIFETDLFESLIQKIPYSDIREKRILADHIRAVVYLIVDGIEPSNKGRGYVLRRLLRKISVIVGREATVPLNQRIGPIKSWNERTYEIIKSIKDELIKLNKEIENKNILIDKIISEEMGKFVEVMKSGSELEKVIEIYKKSKDKKISGKEVFILYSSLGIPLDYIKDEVKKFNLTVNEQEFEDERKKHQELSRTASAGMFKGGLVDENEQTIKYHTATHLLLESLRRVLGGQIMQKGSNINNERLRLDFSYPEKLTAEQIKQVEDMVNEKIKDDLAVKMEEMSVEQAKKQGAVGVFEAKYGERVKVYSIGDFSKEICGGPHIQRTGELGRFKIIKEEASSAGVRRIKAILI